MEEKNMNEMTVPKEGDVAIYKPVESMQRMAVAEVAEKHYRAAKDLTGLRNAIEAIWKERHDFVVWWDAQKTHGGDRKSVEYQSNRPVTLKLDDIPGAPNKMVVSRWRQKCYEDEKYKAIIEAQYAKAAKIIDPDALADKHTGDEESYTPQQYIESARRVMGSIDLDPASNHMAQETVKAAKYFTLENGDDGLQEDWSGKVWMNPPYTARVINEFIAKLASSYESGQVSEAIALTNNNTDTSWFHLAAKHSTAICFTAGRINFMKRDGSTSSPTNGQAFFYFGENLQAFRDEFSAYGLVMEVVG